MNILVTGGAGYIGSILVQSLLDRGHIVTVLDNFMFGQGSLNHLCQYSSLSIINGDVRNENLLRRLLVSVDVVIPLAALVGAPLCAKDPISASSINHDSVMLLLRLKRPDQWILMPTTNSAYGSGEMHNFCTEESPLQPISQYAIEKVRVEKVLLEHENVISLRLATVFGMSPRMRLDLLVNDFVYRAVTDGAIVLFESHFKRNYIHVRDVADTFSHCLDHFSEMSGNVYNVGLSNANLSKLELCEEIKTLVPELIIVEESNRKDPDQRNYIVSNEKLERTGWSPNVSLQDGIKELIKGYQYLRKHGYGNV
jgi:nucleoside-diphosphate-sugar epimerase